MLSLFYAETPAELNYFLDFKKAKENPLSVERHFYVW